MTSDPAQRGEFDLIAKLFAPLIGGDDRALGLLDDAAVIPQKAGIETVISTDTLVAGVHFLMIESADVIARRLLRVNLSDIAAMGATPSAYFLNLSLPSDIGNDWLVKFASGLAGRSAEIRFQPAWRRYNANAWPAGALCYHFGRGASWPGGPQKHRTGG